MRNPLSDKAVSIPWSGIRKFFDVVNEMPDAISLGVGEPDFDTPWHIRDEGIYSLEKGRTFYTSNAGLKELREEIVRYLERRIHVSYDPLREVLITVGGSEGIDMAFRAMLNPGDEVLIPQPSYVSYEPCCVLADGVPVIIELKEENEFRLTARELRDAITDKTKILVLPFPNNPTGAIMTQKDLEEIAEVIIEKDIYVLSDEIYSELSYAGDHVSITSIPGMRERTVLINGFSKAYAIPGWRLGYSAAVGEVAASIKSIQSHATSAANCIAQRAGVAALTGPQDSVEAMRREYERRRDYAFGALKAMPGVELEMPHGAFYLFPKVDSYFGTQYQNYQINSSKDLANYLLDEAEIAVVFGEAFYMNGYLRISYANSMENIQEALRRMAEALKKLGKE